jgi:hypothetical protein
MKHSSHPRYPCVCPWSTGSFSSSKPTIQQIYPTTTYRQNPDMTDINLSPRVLIVFAFPSIAPNARFPLSLLRSLTSKCSTNEMSTSTEHTENVCLLYSQSEHHSPKPTSESSATRQGKHSHTNDLASRERRGSNEAQRYHRSSNSDLVY